MVATQINGEDFEGVERTCAEKWRAFAMLVAAGTSVAAAVAVMVWGTAWLFAQGTSEWSTRLVNMGTDSLSILGWITGAFGLGAAFHARSWVLSGELGPRLAVPDETRVLGRLQYHHQVARAVAVIAVATGWLAMATSLITGRGAASALLCLVTALILTALLAETAGVPDSLGAEMRTRLDADRRDRLCAALAVLRPDAAAGRLQLLLQAVTVGVLQAALLTLYLAARLVMVPGATLPGGAVAGVVLLSLLSAFLNFAQVRLIGRLWFDRQPIAAAILLAVLVLLDAFVAANLLALFEHPSSTDYIVIGAAQIAGLALVLSQIVDPGRWGQRLLAPSIVVSIRRGVQKDLLSLNAGAPGCHASRVRQWYDRSTGQTRAR